MGKKKSKVNKKLSLITLLIALVCACLIIGSFFMPYLSVKGTETNITGMDLTDALVQKTNLSNITNVKMMLLKGFIADSSNIQAATYTAMISALASVIFGGILALSCILGLVLKSKMIRSLGKLSALGATLFGISGLIGCIIMSSVDLALVTLSAGSIIALIGGAVALISLCLSKK